MRYAASSVRGCLLELLDGWRPSALAAQREEAVVDDDCVPAPAGPAWAALDTYLADRRVAVITSPSLPVVSINDPQLRATLDHVAAARALLDGDEARSALLPAGADPRTQARLDGAVVRLVSELGRDLTRTVSLVLHDLHPDLCGIHYRSRHDDNEDCWAIYSYATVHISDPEPLTPPNAEHRAALTSVAAMWHLDLPPHWNKTPARTDRRGRTPSR